MSGNIHDRKHRRISSLNLVNITHFGDKNSPDYEDLGRTKDLSEGGILLECNQAFPIGSKVEVQIAIHDELITARGDIMRIEPVPNSRKCDVGIKFTDITENHRNMIHRYLTEEIS